MLVFHRASAQTIEVVRSDPYMNPDQQPGTGTFSCGSCGAKLVIKSDCTSASGPCPTCGAWLSCPSSEGNAGQPGKPRGTRTPSASGRVKGRISVDSMVDYTHLENRESAKTLKVIACFILVICSCMAATWFLSDWMGK